MALPKAKNKDSGGGDANAWALSYGDMMTLLLTFFVLIVSFSTTELIKFRQAMGSLRGSMGVLLEQDGASVVQKHQTSVNINVQNQMMLQVVREMESVVFEMDLQHGIGIEMHENGLIFRLYDVISFEPGQTRLNPQVYPILEYIGMILQFIPTDVRVEGHTDNIPILAGPFQSNWELSWARSMSVVRYFVNNMNINPTRFASVGCGEYKPVVPNTSPDNRAKNRRVEIILTLEPVITKN